MNTEEQKSKKKKEDEEKPSKVVACNENSYIVDKDQVREDTGLTKDAKILME
jgi:hypothetical protein